MTDQAPGSGSSADQPADGPGPATPNPWSRESSTGGSHPLGADDPAPGADRRDPLPPAPPSDVPPGYGPPSFGPPPGAPGPAAPQAEPQPWRQPPTADQRQQPPYAGPAPYDVAPPYGQPEQGSGYGVPDQPSYGVTPGYGVAPYPGGYGGAYGGYGAPAPDHPQAMPALVTGIIALLTSPLLGLGGLVGIASILLGARARREIDSDPARYGGRGRATAGLALGVVAVVTLVGWVFLALLVVVANTA